MLVRLVTAAVDRITLLRKIILLIEFVVRAVQIVDAGRDDYALGVHPGTFADTVARVHGTGALRGQISVPCLGTRSRRLRKVLAVLVCACETAKVCAFAQANACYKECHIRLLRPRRRSTN
jgi:hypothetical protein